MTHLSDMQLDLHRLGSAPPEVAAHLEGCEVCRARAEALATDAADFAARFEPAVLATATLQAVDARPRRRWFGALAGFGALAAAAGVLLFVRPDPEIVRAKGAGPAVELFVTEAGEITPVKGAVPADAHLAVRLRPGAGASGAREKQVRLLWSSRPGAWRALYPAAEAPSWSVRGEAFLPREIVLDGAREPERLGVVLCERAVDHAAATAALEGAAEPGCAAETLEITKRAPAGAGSRSTP